MKTLQHTTIPSFLRYLLIPTQNSAQFDIHSRIQNTGEIVSVHFNALCIVNDQAVLDINTLLHVPVVLDAPDSAHLVTDSDVP